MVEEYRLCSKTVQKKDNYLLVGTTVDAKADNVFNFEKVLFKLNVKVCKYFSIKSAMATIRTSCHACWHATQ